MTLPIRSVLAAIGLLTIAVRAPAQSADPPENALARKCDSEIPWIRDGVDIVDGTPKPPQAGAANRASLLEQAKKAAREQNRLILWFCPRIPGTHMFRAAVLDAYAKVIFFTDPGIVDLVRSKFIPLRMSCDESLAGSVGLRKPDFIEPGFLFLTPQGRVVHALDRIRTFNADWLRAAMIAVLHRNEGYNAPVGDSVEDLIRGGDDDKALERATPDQKARIFRHAGRHREVLGLPCAALQQGLALLALGDLDAARRVLEKDDSPEALYHRAAIEVACARDPQALWKQLMERHPDSPWAWRAAAQKALDPDGLPRGPMTHLYEDFWAAPPKGLPSTTGEPAATLEGASRRALEFLLRAQRDDGSWSDARYCYGWASYMIKRRIQEGLLDPGYKVWPDTTLRPNLYIAITALSALALAEWRDAAPERIDRALRRAEAYFEDDSRVATGRCEECFAELFRLLYYTKTKDVPRMNRILSRLGKLQDADGFWGHEYPSAFATGAIVHAIAGAKRAGADVPGALLGRAADALERTRREGLRQDYRHEPGKPQSSEKNSSGRTALAELALVECGRSSIENVARGVDVYWKHVSALEAIRACDNHADEELAGFFFFYCVYHSLEAARALEEPARGRHLEKFRAQILSLPEMDGSFVDSHELGKSYGTAMALLILKRLR
jgi:hypothetical protein